MKRLFPLFLLIAILFSGCSSQNSRGYLIGIDSSFSPAVLGGSSENVYGFTVDLLQAISKVENINFKYEQTGSESLLSALKRRQFQGVLSAISPQQSNMKSYLFSKPYFLTGPVLVVPYSSNLTKLDQFESKIVGTLPNSEAFYIVQKYPYIIPATFSSPPFLMEALSYGDIDGVVLSVLPARSFVQNLYRKVLKIASDPLNEEGLRLIVNQDQGDDLINHFNQGLDKCIKRGIYQNLLSKWELN